MAKSISIYELWRSDTNYLHVRTEVGEQISPYEIRHDIIKWIEENCVGKYTNNGSSYDWFFELEIDVTAFKLRWA